MQNVNQSDRDHRIQKIIKILETVDERKLQNIYNFVVHISK